FLIPLVIISARFIKIIEQWLIRTNQIFINAKSNFMQSVITNVGNAGIGCVYPSAVVLVVLQALGNSIKALLMLFFTRKSDYKDSNSLEEKNYTTKELMKKHQDFPFYRAPEEFFSSVTQNLPVDRKSVV